MEAERLVNMTMLYNEKSFVARHPFEVWIENNSNTADRFHARFSNLKCAHATAGFLRSFGKTQVFVIDRPTTALAS